MGTRKDLTALRAQYEDLSKRHDDLLAMTIQRLVDLESSLGALLGGLPKLGFGQTKTQIIETRRRLASIMESLRTELDMCSDERRLLVAETRRIPATLKGIAGVLLLGFLSGEASDAVDSKAIVARTLEAWQTTDETAAEAIEVGERTIEVGVEVAAAVDEPANVTPPMNKEIGSRLATAEADLRSAANTVRASALHAADARYRGGTLEAQAEDVAGLRRYADSEGVAPWTSGIGSILRQVRGLRESSDPGVISDSIAKAEASLSRAMRSVEEARQRLIDAQTDS